MQENKNIGIILKDLESSQLNYLTLNQVPILIKAGYNPFIFYESLSVPCMTPQTSCMNISEAYRFEGLLIGTNINQTLMIDNFLTNNKKILYIWDLEWLRNKNSFLENVRAYRSPEITLAARSSEHARMVQNYCNREPEIIISNFNLIKIIEQCNSLKKTQNI